MFDPFIATEPAAHHYDCHTLVVMFAVSSHKKEKKKEKKRKDYAFRRQINEKPSIIPGCPGCELSHPSLQCAETPVT